MIRISVPATSANIGAGFDTLGIALALPAFFNVEPADTTSISGCPVEFQTEDNLFLRSMRKANEILGYKNRPIRLHIESAIPVARGLGSSAALTVGGVLAAMRRGGAGTSEPLSADEKALALRIATLIEGHPDNAAPALMGGFCASMIHAGADSAMPDVVPAVHVGASPVAESWTFHALIPPFELSTALARAALPASVSLHDAVFNISHAVMTALAFARGDASLLAGSVQDLLHQPYRKSLIPGYDAAMDACRQGGADAVWLSGAGPTIMAVAADQEQSGKLSASLDEFCRVQGWKHLALKPDNRGAEVHDA